MSESGISRDKPGQVSKALAPDWQPGWYLRSGEDEPREAVRYIDGVGFPIAFLQSNEAVYPARPPQRGICVGPRDRDFCLAVPPDYWVVRGPGNDDALYLWSPKEFEQFSRVENKPWTPATTREALADATIEAVAAMTKRQEQENPTAILSGTATPAGRAEATAAAEKVMADLADGAGWKGTEPAPGTRRRTIFEAMHERFPGYTDERKLEIADTAESALLKATLTEPAEGTRRRLIRVTINKEIERTHGVDESVNTREAALYLADAIESALLDATGHRGCAACDSTAADAERSLAAFCEAQESSHADLRVSDKVYAEYHRGAEWAYKILGKRLRGDHLPRERVAAATDRVAPDVEKATEMALECRAADERATGWQIRAERAEKSLERNESICEERWQRIGELEEQIENLKRAGVEVGRAHNMLDGWEIPRTGPDDGDLDPSAKDAARPYTLFQRVGQLTQRLRRAEADLDTEQHRVAGRGLELNGLMSLVRGTGDVRPGTTELHIVIAESDDEDGHKAFFIELEDQDGAGVGGFERRQGDPGLTRIVIPYGRDDEWVQSVAMAAIVAAQEADQPFPGDALDDALNEFGVKPTIPRQWPHRDVAGNEVQVEEIEDTGPLDKEKSEGRLTAFERALREIPVHFDEAEMQAARRIFDDYAEPSRVDERAPVMAADPDREAELLDQREEARAGESTFAEERNAAFALLRWLLPVYATTHVGDPRDEEEGD